MHTSLGLCLNDAHNNRHILNVKLRYAFVALVEKWLQKDIEIQPGFEPWSCQFWSDALTN